MSTGKNPSTPPKSPKNNNNKKRVPNEPEEQSGNSFFQYLPIFIVLSIVYLVLEGGGFNAMLTTTIPYSEFHNYLVKGEVESCQLNDYDIVGVIKRKSEVTTTKEPAATKEPASKDAKPAADAKDSKDSKADSKDAKATAAPAKPEEEKPARPLTALEQLQQLANSGRDSKPTAATNKSGRPQEFTFRTVRVEDEQLIPNLEKYNVKFEGTNQRPLSSFLMMLLFGSIVFLVISFFGRRLRATSQSVLSFGKSKARLVADDDTGVTFDDVAGCEEAKFELQEVVDFLRNPRRYEALGAKIPKGALLVGPPGTGKTLLARAVAGEASVPFFQMSGSDFVEMFVGVGAARVRDLFAQAKAHAPCIIFIDEMDAIGRQRGVHVGAVNDEREQTLNQLLVEMDGFEANVGVIILAATNRPEVLDRALLRPGRFDRQVLVDAPDLDGRLQILRVHARNKKLDPNVDLRRIAQATPRFSGADLANAMNEAALLAARRNHTAISQLDLEEAAEKVFAGPERRSRKLVEEEKRRVAYHEVGHALVGHYCASSDPLHKISIVPRGRAALGYTMQIPTEDQFLLSRNSLLDRIRGLLGGRAAEDVRFGEVSTGAQNDLERATAMAQQMLCNYGMGKSVGLLHVGQNQQPIFLGGDGASQRDCSPETSREIDLEIKELLDHCYADAKKIIEEHRDQLESVTTELLKSEVLDRNQFIELVGPSPFAPAPSSEVPLPQPPDEVKVIPPGESLSEATGEAATEAEDPPQDPPPAS